MNLEREYVTAALNSVHDHLSLLPEYVQRKIELARSLLATHGMATPEELRRELGPNWVIARRSPTSGH